ncbi:MAG: hypothetical protein QW057_07790, partial [Candidatus Bathyarchaeia archaeon]
MVRVGEGRVEGEGPYGVLRRLLPLQADGLQLSRVQSWLRAFNLHQQPEYLKLIALVKEVIG